jgi:TolB-like protein
MSEELERLYARALELPRAERATFAADACAGDERLHAELLSLLAVGERAEGFFARLGELVLSPPMLAEVADRFPPGTVIGRYRVAGRLGHGGMGAVYRAHDDQLDREVALKFLYGLANDADGDARLLAEARAAAALQHPNICVVHEIGQTADGQPFIAMALCDGETLKQRLADGALTPDQAVVITAQLARALHVAHSRHIVHRDVKPGNVMLASDGTAKLLDFGLAASSDVAAARPEATRGTVAYMSPEQARGEPVDHRTDLWSLGVVLYEMLAGRRPFRGDDDATILRAIVHEEPEPLWSPRTGVPAHVVAVVDRLLRKDRDARYASAAAVLTDLTQTSADGGQRRPPGAIDRRRRRALLFAGAAVLIASLLGVMVWSGRRANVNEHVLAADRNADPSIAVLPLVNVSGDPADAPLATGMTEELIATLARAGRARVIASTSTSAFKDRKLDARQIAESLGVSNILEGGIQHSGTRLRVEVRLIAARDGSTLWSQDYDREFKDMFSVQDEIAETVAGELGMRFDKDRQLRRHRTRSIAAYEFYLRGSDPLLLRSESGVWTALDYFQRAIAADSTYAAAYAGLALTQVRRGRTTNDPGMPLRELFALAESTARKAIALDDSLPEAHYTLGRVLEVELQFPAAVAELRRAISLDPTRSIYHRALSSMQGWVGRPEDELAEARLALATDPLNPYARMAMSSGLFANRRYEESLAQLDRVAAMKPPLQALAFAAAQCRAKQGRLSEAIGLLRPQADAGDPMFRGLLGFMLGRAGQRDEAMRLLADLRARREHTGSGAFQVAMVHAGLGDLDEAFAWLDKSVDDRSISTMIMGPTFDDLHRDSRFQKLTDRLGLQRRE